MNKEIDDLICPNDGSRLIKRSGKFYHFKDFKYPIISGIPCLYIDRNNNNNTTDVKKLNNVKKFYTKYPFPRSSRQCHRPQKCKVFNETNPRSRRYKYEWNFGLSKSKRFNCYLPKNYQNLAERRLARPF